jgi:HAD superfamily phosphoserine phosphatase-like hydrolase
MEKLIYDRFSIVIPSYNEAKSVSWVIEQCLAVKQAVEIIVVDDGSKDNTEKAIAKFKRDARFVYIKHKVNKGKGAALKTGFSKAKNKVILFLDADLQNITPAKIRKIAWPVLTDEVDVSRASFTRSRGRATEFAIKPMMRVLFPGMDFKQPITGQVCAKKEFLESLDLEKKYGVDIGILFDAIYAGQRIIEVDIGRIVHKKNTDENIAEMSRQVLETMIKKAGLIQHKYKLIIFTLDETLIRRQTLKQIYEKLEISDIENLRADVEQGKISFKEFAEKIAKVFEGKNSKYIEEMVSKCPLTPYASEVIAALKKRKYQVAIISSNFSPIVLPIANRLGIENVDCIYIDSKEGKLAGKITAQSRERWLDTQGEVTFEKALNRLLKLSGTKPFETIMLANSKKSIPLQRAVGLSIAYKPKDKELKQAVDKTINVLAEILAIVE